MELRYKSQPFFSELTSRCDMPYRSVHYHAIPYHVAFYVTPFFHFYVFIFAPWVQQSPPPVETKDTTYSVLYCSFFKLLTVTLPYCTVLYRTALCRTVPYHFAIGSHTILFSLAHWVQQSTPSVETISTTFNNVVVSFVIFKP